MNIVSVIIPSYYSQSTIKECLSSLQNQNTDKLYEILVINSSPDQTPQIIKQSFPEVKVIQLKKRALAAEARNKGIHEAQGNILAFLDADCVASPDWLDQMLSWHQKGYRAVGGSLENGNPDNLYSRAEYPLEIIEFSPLNPKKEVNFISAANCSLERSLLNQYGLFPEIRAGEDVLFCHRLSKKKEKILFDPQIKVIHKNDIDLSRFINKQIMHGKYSYAIRKISRMSGSLMSHPLVLPLITPFLPLIRAARVLLRSLFLGNKFFLDILRVFPFFFLGCMMWSLGFIKGYLENRNILKT